MHTRILAAVTCAALPAAASLAQIVTQPPGHAPRPEQYIQVALNKPAGPGRPEPTPVPSRSLVERDETGAIVPLREPIEVAALRINSLVTPQDFTRIQPVLDERQRAYDRIVIDNLDLAEKVEGGVFETIDLADNKAFSKLLDVAKPLRPEAIKPLAKTLTERGLLTRDQQLMNDKIVRDYKFTVIPPAQGDARRSLALVYKQGLDEPMFEYRRLRLAAARSLPKTISSLSLEPKAADSAKKAVAALRPDSDDAALLKALDEVNKGLNLDQQKQLLREASGH